jgi:hypothetical protein
MDIYVLVIRNKLLFILQIAGVCIRRFKTFFFGYLLYIQVDQDECAMLRENVPYVNWHIKSNVPASEITNIVTQEKFSFRSSVHCTCST